MDTSELGRYLQKYRPQELHVEGEKKKKSLQTWDHLCFEELKPLE